MRWLELVLVTILVLATQGKKFGKKSRNKNTQDYSKIMEEYLLRTFDGGSRGDGGVEEFQGLKNAEVSDVVKRIGGEDYHPGFNGDLTLDFTEAESIESVDQKFRIGNVGRLDEDIIAEVGSGEEESETNESLDGDSDIEDVDIGSGSEEEESNESEEEESSASEEEESTVLNSAPYSMVSIDGETTVNIILQDLSTSDILNMVCDVSTDNSDLFAEADCVPEIYMVSGVASCSSLPDQFSAKKLADVHGEGLGELFVDATWTELPGKCLVMLKPTSCEEDDSVEVEIIEVGEEGSGEAEGSADSAGQRSSRNTGILRSAGLGRSYGLISLSSFTLLSSGSSTVFTVSKPSVPIFGGVIPGIVHTPYDKFSTLPYLQLPGWTATDAIMIALSMVVLYYGYAYVNAESVSLAPLKRKLFNEAQIERVDALHSGMAAIADTYLLSMSNPWKNILENIDRNLLKRSESTYVNKNKFLKKKGRPFSSSPKLAHKSGIFDEKEGWQKSWETKRNSQWYES